MLPAIMSILTAVRDIDRLRQITQVLARHGFGEVVTRLGLSSHAGEDQPVAGESIPRPLLGERIRLVAQDLGPTFVKLGQIMSTRSDILPEDIVLELRKLQDDVAPFPAEEAHQQVEAALGAKVSEIFVTFEDKPLACASVAQVHKATLKVEGEPEPVAVAVKIQRPGIDKMVARDLNLLHMLAALVERTIPESRLYSPPGLVREFDRAITAELDFIIEAQNAARFEANFIGEETLKFPRVYAQASSKKVLTLEFLDGPKVTDAVKLGADGKWLGETAVRLILKMLFEDGFFHADPHPGNIKVQPAPPEGGRYDPETPLIIGLLDLGLVGRLSPRMRDQAVDLLMAAARNDADAMADAMLAIGHAREKVNREEFRNYVRVLAERHLGKDLQDMEASAIVRDIIVGAMKYHIEIPTELTMMVRAIMTIEGVGKEIHPELDIMAVAKPYLAKIILQRYHPLKLGNELLNNAGRLTAVARDLPFQVQEIVEDLRQGRLEVQTRDPQKVKATERLGFKIRGGIISAALLFSGASLVESQTYGSLGLWLMAAAGVWLTAHLLLDWKGSSSK